MSTVFKAQIDWVLLSVGAVRSTRGKTLAVMRVWGGSQSFSGQSTASTRALDAHVYHP